MQGCSTRPVLIVQPVLGRGSHEKIPECDCLVQVSLLLNSRQSANGPYITCSCNSVFYSMLFTELNIKNSTYFACTLVNATSGLTCQNFHDLQMCFSGGKVLQFPYLL